MSRLLLLALLAAASLPAATRDFTGTWVNADPTTRSITRVRVSRSPDSIYVQAWGQCSPRDCDWGRVTARAYSSSVSTSPQRDAHTLVASFRSGASRKQLVLTLDDDQQLRGELMTVFTDSSDRSRHASTVKLRRSGQATLETPPAPAEPEVKVILHADGSIEELYPDGTRIIFTQGGQTIIGPDGTVQTLSFFNAQPGSPPPVPANTDHRLWFEAHAEQLLGIISDLAGEAVAQEYVAGYEADKTLFEKMQKRTWLISKLAPND